MLHLFRNKSPYTVLILLIVALLLKSGVLAHPQAPARLDGYFLYNAVIGLLNVVVRGNAFFYTFLAVIMLFLQALYINAITTRHRLSLRPTYFPALAYILFTSIHPAFNYFGVPVLVNWCMLIGMDIWLGFNHSVNPRKNLFNAAFAVSLAAVLHFAGVGYLAVFLGALLLLRPYNTGELIVAGMGYLTPLYFSAGILFIVDMLPELARWPNLDFTIMRRVDAPVYLGIALGGAAILVASGVYAMQQYLPKATIYVRRGWMTILFYLIMSVLVAALGDVQVNNAWLFTIPALSMFIAQGFMLEKSKWFSNFIFYFSIILVLACQWAVNK
ncbi:MAG: hypothetical protein JNL72_10255 [Flavipsychrobacter sp.]|nr:hypothetical protein [Flavipsychrobacter sp.]